MKKTILSIALGITSISMLGVNPLVSTKYTADPAPYVHGDTIYLYTTHDEDDAEGFKMYDWLLYTSTDMVNWTDHGAVASLGNFEWYDKDNGAWAEQVIERNGKWYMYCPIHGSGISVLVADNPYGPFVDVLGHPLVWQKEHWNDIDPTILIDDNGQAYMYWGNPSPYYVKLNRDMISYSGGIVRLPNINDYQEGPWFFKRNDKYYLAFASTCCPEGIGYAMSNSPEGPWTAMGDIMPHTEKSRGNHPGVIEYKGKWYVFGLNYDLNKELQALEGKEYSHCERRSVSAAELKFNPDGTIIPVDYWTEEGLAQVEWFNPYKRVEAETQAKSRWVKTAKDAERGIYITNIDNGDYIMLQGVDFGDGAKKFVAEAAPIAGGKIEFRLDSVSGPVVGTIDVKGKEGVWKQYNCKANGATGIHDLYIVFVGGDGQLMNFDWWQAQ